MCVYLIKTGTSRKTKFNCLGDHVVLFSQREDCGSREVLTSFFPRRSVTGDLNIVSDIVTNRNINKTGRNPRHTTQQTPMTVPAYFSARYSSLRLIITSKLHRIGEVICGNCEIILRGDGNTNAEWSISSAMSADDFLLGRTVFLNFYF